MTNPIEIAKSRPAETAMPIATVFAALIARLAGVEDTDTILYLALALSFVPAIVTWFVELIRKKPDV
jgi:Na+-transporting NADH:ubiquinone oxidoreductase subunit NqrD